MFVHVSKTKQDEVPGDHFWVTGTVIKLDCSTFYLSVIKVQSSFGTFSEIKAMIA